MKLVKSAYDMVLVLLGEERERREKSVTNEIRYLYKIISFSTSLLDRSNYYY
jgi:hypothetical protein